MKIRLMLLCLSALAIFTGLLVVANATQQSKERLIRRLPIEENEPVAITNIKVNDQSVSFDKKFSADDEWLRSLVVTIKNKSDKLILFASIRLQFPRATDSRDRISIYDVSYGNVRLRSQRPTAEERLVGIAAGETAVMQLSGQQVDSLKELLTATQYPGSIETVDLSLGNIIFADDTMWYAGSQAQRDPKDPSRWVNSQYANSKPQ
jgi:hypothetical protein